MFLLRYSLTFSTLNAANYACTVKLSGHKVIIKGQEHLELDKMKLKLHVGDAQIELLNLFNGDPVLGERSVCSKF